jgi:hypothetical protein
MRNISESLLAAFGEREGELPHERTYPSPLRWTVNDALAGLRRSCP